MAARLQRAVMRQLLLCRATLQPAGRAEIDGDEMIAVGGADDGT